MKSAFKIILFAIILFSCKNSYDKSINVVSSLSGDDLTESFFQMNERLISSIYNYQAKIEFTDSLIWDHNIRLNTKKIIEHYYKSFEIPSLKISSRTVDSLYQLNRNYLLDSLFRPHLSELHNQQNEFKEIEKIAKIIVNDESEEMLKGSQIVKNQIFYNHVFQFLFRYKLEEEMRTNYNYAVITKDSLLANGNRELSIYLVNSLKSDNYQTSMEFDNTYYDLNALDEISDLDGKIRIQYDPKTIKDSITIKTLTHNKFTEETVQAQMKYKLIK